MNKKYIFIGLLIVVALHYVFYLLGTIKITARFKELEPFRRNIPVYYKGFRLGSTTKVHPGEDYRTTLIDMRIKSKNLQLPANTEIVIRRKDKKDYIELVYPNSPYIQTLKYGDVVDGHLGVNFENFIEEQARNGSLDEIKGNVNATIVSAGETFDALTQMIQVMTDILKDAQPMIQDSIVNVNVASKNIADSSLEIKRAMEKGYLDKSLYNLQETSNNLVLTTKNTSGFTANLSTEGNVLFNCLLKNLNIVVRNVNEIIVGLGNTLKKRFGGLRLVFGKTLQ